MSETLAILSLVLGAANLALLLVILLRKREGGDAETAKTLRRLEEKTDALGASSDFLTRGMDSLARSVESRLQHVENRLAEDFKYIVDTNAQNLERIRRTVDEKLTSSIDGKLSESYARIVERLEKMYESVGAMKGLTENVADIRRVFTNVKLRGTWGEAQLDALLDQMLAPQQYERSVKLNPLDGSLVDFAVRLPAQDGETVYLPIDSKFPVETFERLVDASERGDKAAEMSARKELETAVKRQADSIAKKYILPPATTDFALLYLPSESLYAEVARITGLSDFLHARRIIVCGPTNLGALLSTLQTGFRTAAIVKRSGELTEMLETFRADFAKFADLLEKTKRKLQEAQDTVESAEKRTGAIGRKLDSFRGFGELPPSEE